MSRELTREQVLMLDGIRADYGVAEQGWDGLVVTVVDGKGDCWRIEPDGDCFCFPADPS